MVNSVCEKKLIRPFIFYVSITQQQQQLWHFSEFNRDTPVVKGEQFLPSIYIFSLGKVKELRESLNITNEHNDDFVVAKYGYTKDFTNTTKTLREKYEHIDKVDLQLLHHYYIDQKHIFKAEKEIRDTLVYHHYQPYNMGEFIIIPTFMKHTIQHIYGVVSQKYIGKNAFIMNKLSEHELVLLRQKNRLEHTIQINKHNTEQSIHKLEHTIKINKLDTEISIIKLERIINVQKKDMEIEKKNMEIEKMGMEIEKNKFIIEQHMKMKAMEQQILDQKIIIENMTKTQKN